ncbi:MAG: hypothetical protein N3E37_03340 [Candidatus Micrarchaeota archaeon]|nr:hypothetical protein [Candidatus Micrarchaeota archaeon]
MNFKLDSELSKKAQASLETALLVALFLVLVIPTIAGIYIMSKNTNDESTIFHAKIAAKVLAQRMYEIDSRPSNSSANFVLYIPQGTKNIYFENFGSSEKRLTKITFTMLTPYGESNISSVSIASMPSSVASRQFLFDGAGGIYQVIMNKTFDSSGKEGVDVNIIT